MGFQQGCTINLTGTAGGLTLWWKPEVRIDFISKNRNLFDTVIHFANGYSPVRISWFYAPSYDDAKPHFWSSVSNLGVGETMPWMCNGDFNTIIDNSEQSSGNPLRWNRRNYLKDFSDSNSLLDLGFCGNIFTWDNRQEGDDLIQERFDRALCNFGWLERFPDCKVQHLTCIGSNHCPILITPKPTTANKSSIFRFDANWSKDEICIMIIDEAWRHGEFLNPYEQRTPSKSRKMQEWLDKVE